MLAFKSNNTWMLWTGQQRPRSLGGTYSLPPNAETLLTDTDLAEYGLARVIEPSIPAGKIVTSWSIQDQGGVPVRVNVLEDVPPPPPPTVISRRQCAAEMFARGLITGAEAVAMSTTGAPPAMVETMISSLPEPGQTFARIDFAASNYERTNVLLIDLLMAVPGTTEADIDQFFRDAAAR